MADDDTAARVPDADRGLPSRTREAGSGGGGLVGRDLIGLGGFVAGAVVGGLLLGIFLDRQADSSPRFTLAGIGLGVAFGVFGFVARVRRALRG
jgi:F0F1-type ATP synthase assembly protein I